MRLPWLRSFAGHHLPMLYWLAAVASGAIGATLALRSNMPDSLWALVAIPLLLMAGLAAGLAELVLAWRLHRDDYRALGASAIGTMGLGVVGLPLAGALVAITIYTADTAALLGDLSTYRQVIADVRRGAIPVPDTWQTSAGVTFTATTSPQVRVVFAAAREGTQSNGIAYDPSGDVAAGDPAKLLAEDPRRRIGAATVVRCRATLVAAYYRCDVAELYAD